MTTQLAPRSPFGSHSWEPRFVVEHYDRAALAHAVALWQMSSYGMRFATNDSVRFVARGASWLVLHQPSTGDAFPRDLWETLPAPLALRDAPEYIAKWLGTATYPEQPWFDGGEAQGFCAYWGHYGCEEVHHRAYGGLVVIPKWFEIHK